MQLETYDDMDGRRVRLTDGERDRLLGEYNHDTRRQIGLALMARCGCRCQEAVDVRVRDIRDGDVTDRTFLRIPDGKGGKERQTPMPQNLTGMIRAHTNNKSPDDFVLEVTTRTLRRWVVRAAEQRAAKEDDRRWQYVRPHDLRRTWGHLMLEEEVLPSVLMQWGGWEDYETFKKHYLGKHSEKVMAAEASKVGWL